MVVAICSGMGATIFNFKASTDFSLQTMNRWAHLNVKLQSFVIYFDPVVR